jgi:hypothetical protein
MTDNNKRRNNHGMWIFIAIIMTVIVAMAGCVDNKESQQTPVPTESGQQTPVPTVTDNGPIGSGTGTMIEKYDLEKLISMADSILIADVTEILPSKWNTQDGNKPMSGGIIYTDVRITPEEYLKNPLDGTIVTVRMLGGTVGQDASDVEGQPSFRANEKILVFLKKDTDPRTKDIGEKHFVVAGLLQGKISISQNGDIIVGDKEMTLDEIRTMMK